MRDATIYEQAEAQRLEAVAMLEYIDAGDYDKWLRVGMILKSIGLDESIFDTWSRSAHNYEAAAVSKKWNSFKRGNGVGMGTLAKLARDAGYDGNSSDYLPEGTAVAAARESISAYESKKKKEENKVKYAPIINQSEPLPAVEVPEPPEDYHRAGADEMRRYIQALFRAGDTIQVVSKQTAERSFGISLPKTYDEVMRILDMDFNHQSFFRDGLRLCTPASQAVNGRADLEFRAGGSFVRINPSKGQGDGDVTTFRHVLVESDTMSFEEQLSFYREMNLPCAAIVHSGGKSIHAVVKVDARDIDEYTDRTRLLYGILERNGFSADQNTKNPSRYTRVAGVFRGEKPQYLIDTNCGAEGWLDWLDWVEDRNDDLPDIVRSNMKSPEPPVLTPLLIEGLLREGRKMIISGPSKAGKSWSLVQLAIALQNGTDWMGHKIMKRTKTLYVNMEIPEDEMQDRFWQVRKAIGPHITEEVYIWNLRGAGMQLDKLAPKLIRKCKREKFGAIILDPLYKLLTGSENDAKEMAEFCGYIDRVAKDLGCAVIYSHHHSKGAQGGKSAIDRGSGSGVFGRDPDAILDMIQLDIPEDVGAEILSKWTAETLAAEFDAERPQWRDEVSQDDAVVGDKLAKYGVAAGMGDLVREICPEVQKSFEHATGWRVSATLRSFANPKPRRCFFRYPRHVDHAGLLHDCIAAGEELPPHLKRKAQEKKEQQKEDRRRMEALQREAEKEEAQRKKRNEMRNEVLSVFEEGITIGAIAIKLDRAVPTIRERIKKYLPELEIREGKVYRAEELES